MMRPYKNLTKNELESMRQQRLAEAHNPKANLFDRNFAFNRLKELLAELDRRDLERVQETF